MLSHGKTGSRARSDGRTWFDLALLAGIVTICYLRTLGVPFYFDDYSYILENPFIKTLGGVFDREAIIRSDLLADLKNSLISRPLAYFSFAFNYWLHQDRVAGYHLLNILIHLANCCLVYLLIRTLPFVKSAVADPDRSFAANRSTALGVAALFASHPVMTGAVTYVTQRMAALSAMFCLSCVACYVSAVSSTGKLTRICWYAAALLSCVAAMQVRESSFLLPFMLLLADMIFCAGTSRQRIGRLLPFLGILLLTVALLGSADSGGEIQRNGPTTLDVLKVAKSSPGEYFFTQFATNPNMTSITSMSPYEYLVTQFRVIVTYQRLLLVPVGLNFSHDYPFYRTLTDPVILGSLLLHLALICGAILLLRQSRRSMNERRFLCRLAAFGIFWFYLCLAMESSIIPMDDLLLEHRTYLPAFGFLTACVSLLQIALRPVPVKMVMTTVVITFMTLTLYRNELWRDPLVFWQDALAKSPNKKRIHGYIGNVYRDRGDMPRALQEYRLMLANDFRYGQDHFELGELLLENGMHKDAVEEYLTALRIRPDKTFVYGRLAEAYRLLGEARLAGEVQQKVTTASEVSGNGKESW